MTHAVKEAAKFLKSTLRLPSTTFPARPAPADLAKYLPLCSDDLYSWQRRERPASDSFILHDGPPYANGDLHVGHALNKIVKDIICRTSLARGKRVEYVPGWDCHGLPIELKALERHGWKRGQGVDAVSIRSAAKAFAQDAIKKQKDGFRSWAVMGDWENHWETMQKDFEIRQLEVFRAMVEHGLIYRQHKPVYWSPSSGTALAEAEIEYKDDYISTAAYVKFPLRHTKLNYQPAHALIWTTTPWTLPANQAIALNASLEYSLVHSNKHGLLVIASARMEALQDIIGRDAYVVQKDISVNKLLGASYDGLPQFGREAMDRPIISADFVSADSGTGLVHCAPAHGMEDYQALRQLMRDGRVQVRSPVDGSGLFDATASPEEPSLLEGRNILTDGNDLVLTWLENAGRLVHKHEYVHKYPIDWRTKEPVIIRATSQWFADLSSIKEDAIHAIEQTRFVPESGNNRLRSFIANRSEWCISRQRSWGVPIPSIYHRNSGEAVLSTKSVNHIINTIKERGIDAWWSDSDDDPAWICPDLDSSHYRRGTDTMDVWFDSGSSWMSMLSDEHVQEGPLADVYFEGTDQHRGWFQSSLLTNIAYQKSKNLTDRAHAPFRTLITHGFTLDTHGKKMSKSLGNVISPSQIIAGDGPLATYKSKIRGKDRIIHSPGPDALRLWVASSDWTKDVIVSDKVISTAHSALDKYRVTIKLLLGLLKDFDPSTALPYNQLSMLDQMALLRLHEVWSHTHFAYLNFEFHRVTAAVTQWVVADLSGFYFEAIKDICYCDSPSNPRRISVCTTLHHIVTHIQRMLGPITPLLVEESWEHSSETYRSSLRHPLKDVWQEPPPEWHNTGLHYLVPMVMGVNTAVKAAQEQARRRKLLGQSLASEVRLHCKPGAGVSTVPLETWREVLVVSKVEVLGDYTSDGVQEDATSTDAGEWVYTQEIIGAKDEKIGLAVVTGPTMEKCARCWKYVAEPAGEHELSLCTRCSTVVEEVG